MTQINTGPMYLVYVDGDGNHHSQPWNDISEVGALIDPDTGDDLKCIGWSSEEV